MCSSAAAPKKQEATAIDVIWLKRDVRLADHGSFAEVQRSGRAFAVVYLYEPDQLNQSSVHGSHIGFINEGLSELDSQLASILRAATNSANSSPFQETQEAPNSNSHNSQQLQAITVCYADCIDVLEALNNQRGIARLLAHEETGHMASYIRDRRVRKYCKDNRIQFLEFPNSGVKRRLRNRDDFSKHFHAFMNESQYPSTLPNSDTNPSSFGKRLLRPNVFMGKEAGLPGLCTSLLPPDQIKEIPLKHQGDRPERQKGGTDEAMRVLYSFLQHRGVKYSQGISSPNSSWHSCSRLSPYLTWGHISLRQVVQAIHQRKAQLKAHPNNDARWLKSFSAVLSRMHWRSHFMQKLESEPELEERDLCPAFQHLRRQPGDWNEAYYQAWATGQTGYPFVDACMRCLHRNGWINFRMRAMLVSFAVWNLWLDWKRIAPHLARLFLDYEPGIHYPQLQMQAGTTGINAMRVYSVTKQGKEQDPDGVFIRKYVPELHKVPTKYIHEPWTIPKKLQLDVGVILSSCVEPVDHYSESIADEINKNCVYPLPIVEEKEAAKVAKTQFTAVRKLKEAKLQSEQVYEKHGSRGRSDFRSGKKTVAPAAKKPKHDDNTSRTFSNGQQSIKTMFQTTLSSRTIVQTAPKRQHEVITITDEDVDKEEKKAAEGRTTLQVARCPLWRCNACTFENDRPEAPVCAMCSTQRAN